MASTISKFSVFFLLVFAPIFVFAQPEDIEVYGTVKEGLSKLRGASVTVYSGGKQYLSESAASGAFSFHLPYGQDYVIHFSKSGYVTKMIEVKAKGVERELVQTKQKFDKWEVSLFKRLDGVDYSDLDEPIGKVFFDFKKREFASDSEYALGKLKKIEELEKKQEKRQKELEKEEEEKVKAAAAAASAAAAAKEEG